MLELLIEELEVGGGKPISAIELRDRYEVVRAELNETINIVTVREALKLLYDQNFIKRQYQPIRSQGKYKGRRLVFWVNIAPEDRIDFQEQVAGLWNQFEKTTWKGPEKGGHHSLGRVET